MVQFRRREAQACSVSLWGSGPPWSLLLLLTLSSTTAWEETSICHTSYPSLGQSRSLQPTPTKMGRVLLTPSLSLEQGPTDGLQNCPWAKRSKKGKGDHHRPLPIVSGLQEGLTGEGGGDLFPLKGSEAGRSGRFPLLAMTAGDKQK